MQIFRETYLTAGEDAEDITEIYSFLQVSYTLSCAC